MCTYILHILLVHLRDKIEQWESGGQKRVKYEKYSKEILWPNPVIFVPHLEDNKKGELTLPIFLPASLDDQF